MDELNNSIYFYNPKDNSRLNSLDFNGNNLKKATDESIKYLAADGKYLNYSSKEEV